MLWTERDPRRLLGRRFTAWLVDVVVTIVVLRSAGALVAIGHGPGRHIHGWREIADLVLLPTLGVVYFSVVGSTVGTLGHRVFDLRVAKDGLAATISVRLRRCLAWPIAFAPFGIGYLWTILDPEFRSWVDRMTSTDIVRTRHLTPPPEAMERDEQTPHDEPTPALETVTRVEVDRLRAVTEALESGGHWGAAGTFLYLLASHRADPDEQARAAWLLARSETPVAALDITKQRAADGELPGTGHAARAVAFARSSSAADAAQELEQARRVGIGTTTDALAASAVATAARDVSAARTLMSALDASDGATNEILVARSQLADLAGDQAEARAAVDLALDRHPHDLDALRQRAALFRPRSKRHGPPSRAELDALVAVLRAAPTDSPARTRLARATVSQHHILLFAAIAAVWVAFTTANAHNSGSWVLAGLVGVGVVGLVGWNRLVRTRMDEAVRSWSHYFSFLRSAARQRKTGRLVTAASIAAAAPPDSVLQHPEQCHCSDLVRVTGTTAVEYARAHLVDAKMPPGPGIIVLSCPSRRALYVGIDGNVVLTESQALLLRVESITIETTDTDLPTGLYL